MSISRFQATVPTPKVQNDRGFHLRLLLQTQFANLHLLRNFPKQKMISKQRDICSSEICTKYALISQSFLVVHQYTPLRNELLCQLFRALRKQWIPADIKVWYSLQLKNQSSLENGLKWQCCLASSSKTDFDFSIAMCAKTSFQMKSTATEAP